MCDGCLMVGVVVPCSVKRYVLETDLLPSSLRLHVGTHDARDVKIFHFALRYEPGLISSMKFLKFTVLFSVPIYGL